MLHRHASGDTKSLIVNMSGLADNYFKAYMQGCSCFCTFSNDSNVGGFDTVAGLDANSNGSSVFGTIFDQNPVSLFAVVIVVYIWDSHCDFYFSYLWRRV